MTPVQRALAGQLQSLENLLLALNHHQYCHISTWLSGASIGQHCRHIIELVQCLQAGYHSGTINYDARNRNHRIESEPHYASEMIQMLLAGIIQPDKPLMLIGNFSHADNTATNVSTTYNRELVYNIEHSVHHMALIRVALKELDINLTDETFGVAYATVQYRKACAQ